MTIRWRVFPYVGLYLYIFFYKVTAQMFCTFLIDLFSHDRGVNSSLYILKIFPPVYKLPFYFLGSVFLSVAKFDEIQHDFFSKLCCLSLTLKTKNHCLAQAH